MANQRVEIRNGFYINNEEVKIISGGIHYFRTVPEYWRDRLEKLKNMGCNTVETYIAWNMHEPKKGVYSFEGMMDIKAFIQLAAELDLFVIVRPSPYICAEWEFGGLPAWLLAEEGIRLRGCCDSFINHVRDYYQELFKILTPLQFDHGGPIIMMQVENEYGYYGDDTKYLEIIRDIMVDNGVVVPMVTSDGPWGDALSCGTIEGCLPTGNFGSKAIDQFSLLSKYTNGGPLMCMEFWVGWFDHWGVDKHQTSDLEDNIKNLEDILRLGHVNIYMFHGGTNFGFMNGANYYDALTPDVTSYDYDAVLTESGNITPKYKAFRKVISKFVNLEENVSFANIPSYAYGELKVKAKVGLFEVMDLLTTGVESTFTKSMELMGQNYGYILYRSTLQKEKNLEKLKLLEANDRAQVFIDNKPVISLYDRELLEEIKIEVPIKKESEIDILVENMGRVNFGPNLQKQRKGINGGVLINGHQHLNWSHYPLELNNVDQIDFTKGYEAGLPAFYQFEFLADEISDTYLDFTGWGKGCAFINGHNLGRFWERGPQKRLYIPGPFIKKGSNTIVLFETEGIITDNIILVAEPCLG